MFTVRYDNPIPPRPQRRGIIVSNVAMQHDLSTVPVHDISFRSATGIAPLGAFHHRAYLMPYPIFQVLKLISEN